MRILNKFLAVALVAGVAVATTAKAEDLMAINEASWKNIYLHASIGMASYNIDQSDIGETQLDVMSDDDDFAYRIGIGYQFNDVFAAEFAYSDLGSPVHVDASNPGADTPTNTLDGNVADDYYGIADISAIANLNIPELDEFSPFFRVGGSAFDTNKDDGFYVHYGAGMQWKLLRLEYIRYHPDPEPIDTFFLGVALPLSLFAR